MGFGDKKAEKTPEAREKEPVSDSRDTVRVSEQLMIVKAATSEEQLDVIAAADRRPGVGIAIRARRDELKHILEIAAVLASGADPKVAAPEGLIAHEQARAVAKDHPPAGRSGKSCGRCANRISLARTYSTVDCEKIRPGQRITVGTPTAEDCDAYTETKV